MCVGIDVFLGITFSAPQRRQKANCVCTVFYSSIRIRKALGFIIWAPLISVPDSMANRNFSLDQHGGQIVLVP